jgi:hypothetical protein
VNAPKPAEQIQWPAPPYAVERLALYRRAAGWFLLLLTGSLMVALTVGFFTIHDAARNLLLDTMASLGIGRVEVDSRVQAQPCSGNRCRLVIRRRAPSGAMEQIVIDAVLDDPADAARVTEVRNLFGVVALRWPARVLLGQWLELMPLALPLVMFEAIYWLAHWLLRQDRLKVRAGRDGVIVPADLLFHDTVWHFAYRDRRDRQRFA